MAAGSALVSEVSVKRMQIDFGHKTAGAELAAAALALMPGATRPEQVFPLAPERITVVFEGVPTAVPNAIRRTLKDELRSYCLTFGDGDLDRAATTDPFMSDENFLLTRLRMIPLRPQISESLIKNLRFELNAVNTTDRTMDVFSGDLIIVSEGVDLAEPLFNPTHQLATLRPGRTLHVRNIRLVEGYGNQDAAFVAAVRAATRPLDLTELPREATHTADGAAAQQSGFAESTFTANPRRHKLTAIIPAAPEGGAASIMVLVDACASIMNRLRFILNALEGERTRGAALAGQDDAGAATRSAGAHFHTTTEGARTRGVLSVKGETNTIGQLLRRYVYELVPDISYVNCTSVPHEKSMNLTVCHAVPEANDLKAIIVRAVKHSYAVFSKIQQEIRAKM